MKIIQKNKCLLTPPIILQKLFFSHSLDTRPPSGQKCEKVGVSDERDLPVDQKDV